MKKGYGAPTGMRRKAKQKGRARRKGKSAARWRRKQRRKVTDAQRSVATHPPPVPGVNGEEKMESTDTSSPLILFQPFPKWVLPSPPSRPSWLKPQNKDKRPAEVARPAVDDAGLAERPVNQGRRSDPDDVLDFWLRVVLVVYLLIMIIMTVHGLTTGEWPVPMVRP